MVAVSSRNGDFIAWAAVLGSVVAFPETGTAVTLSVVFCYQAVEVLDAL
jgi:hypothetical protein